MSEIKAAAGERTCFVVMGFGKKTDFELQKVLDLDKSYFNMIKPAVEEAGLKCIRADEIVHSGVIDIPMYEQLLQADVVVADLSTSNKNAFYELGVRHALRPFTTIVICEDGIKSFPFDINHVVVRPYHHLGEDIGYGEVVRFKKELSEAIRTLLDKKDREDSPVYASLKRLNPPSLAAEIQKKVQEAVEKAVAPATGAAPAPSMVMPSAPPRVAPAAPAAGGAPATPAAAVPGAYLNQSYSERMLEVDTAQSRGDWAEAKRLLIEIRDKFERQDDAYILQRLALATYKNKQATGAEGLHEACDVLAVLRPESSNDPETLGLWGAINKRIWEVEATMDALNAAIFAYERGFYLRNDYYNGINYAFLLNVRAAETADPAEAIADFVDARRARMRVLGLCEAWLRAYKEPDKMLTPPLVVIEIHKTWYWVKATMGEALVGLGEDVRALPVLEAAYAKAPGSWMADSTKEQVGKLRKLLENDPRKLIGG